MRDLPNDEMRDRLFECLSVERWVDDVMQFAPYDDLGRLLEVAEWAAEFTPAELAEALADHPRIGEKPQGQGRSQQFSRSEQQSADADDEAVNAAIAEGNARYEKRFDRVFLIRARGRSRREMLSELTRRLTLDPQTEQRIVAHELREITLLRLAATFGEES